MDSINEDISDKGNVELSADIGDVIFDNVNEFETAFNSCNVESVKENLITSFGDFIDRTIRRKEPSSTSSSRSSRIGTIIYKAISKSANNLRKNKNIIQKFSSRILPLLKTKINGFDESSAGNSFFGQARTDTQVSEVAVLGDIIESTVESFEARLDESFKLFQIGLEDHKNITNGSMCQLNDDIIILNNAGYLVKISQAGVIQTFKEAIKEEGAPSVACDSTNNRIFASNKGIQKIIIFDDSLSKIKELSYASVDSIALDSSNRIWAYNKEEQDFVRIDVSTDSVAQTIDLSSALSAEMASRNPGLSPTDEDYFYPSASFDFDDSDNIYFMPYMGFRKVGILYKFNSSGVLQSPTYNDICSGQNLKVTGNTHLMIASRDHTSGCVAGKSSYMVPLSDLSDRSDYIAHGQRPFNIFKTSGGNIFHLRDDGLTIYDSSKTSINTDLSVRADTQYKFVNPHDLVVTPNGNIHVADYRNGKIKVYDNKGSFLLEFGAKMVVVDENEPKPSEDRYQEFTHFFSYDYKDGKAYIGLYQKYIIRVEGIPDTFTTEFLQNYDEEDDTTYQYLGINGFGSVLGSGSGEVQTFPASITAVEVTNQHIYVAEGYSGSNKVYRLDLDGSNMISVGTTSSGTEDGVFNYPHGLAYDRNGLLFVSDAVNNRLQVFTKDLIHLKTFASNSEKTEEKFDETYRIDTARVRVGRDLKDVVFVTNWKSRVFHSFTYDASNTNDIKFNFYKAYTKGPGTKYGRTGYPGGAAFHNEYIYFLDHLVGVVRSYHYTGLPRRIPK